MPDSARTTRSSQAQVKVNTKQAADDLSDTVVQWGKAVGLFLVIMYGLTIGYDQAAWFFGLPQASPTEVGGVLLVTRIVVSEVKRIVSIFRT